MIKDDNVTLYINGMSYSGWQTVSIQRSIDAIAMGFSISLTEKWTYSGIVRPIREGDSCILKIGNDKIIEGYIDDVDPTFTKDTHSIKVTGRSKAGDLIDCSVDGQKWEFNKQPLENIIQAILYSFGLKVTKRCDTGDVFSATDDPAEKFGIEQGETAFEAIDRACKMRGVLPISDASGNIELVRAGSDYCADDLVVGKNIEYVNGHFSMKGRYSKYTVKGQSPGNDFFSGEKISRVAGTSTDPNVKRYRPLVIMAETIVNNKLATARADWEASVRAGKAGTITVGVTGWRMSNGELWPINKMVDVDIPQLQINNAPLLISSTNFNLDKESGKVAELTLCRQDAYNPEYWKQKKSKPDEWADVKKAARAKK
jgi:prophage tail gpP-like protein